MAEKRRCQTGRIRPVLVEGYDPPVKLYVRTTFGRVMQLAEEMKTVPDASQSDALPVMLRFLEESIRDWSGVADENGEELPYVPEALRELDVEDLTAFINAIQTGG